MSELGHDILALAAQYEPADMLAVGDPAAEILSRYRDPEPRLERYSGIEAALAELTPTRQYDFALLAGCLEQAPDRQGMALLARLRDVQVQRFAVVVPEPDAHQQAGWTRDNLIALGLSVYGHYTEGPTQLMLATYDIANYKRTPDWLSPENWANPELWDKYRW